MGQNFTVFFNKKTNYYSKPSRKEGGYVWLQNTRYIHPLFLIVYFSNLTVMTIFNNLLRSFNKEQNVRKRVIVHCCTKRSWSNQVGVRHLLTKNNDLWRWNNYLFQRPEDNEGIKTHISVTAALMSSYSSHYLVIDRRGLEAHIIY